MVMHSCLTGPVKLPGLHPKDENFWSTFPAVALADPRAAKCAHHFRICTSARSVRPSSHTMPTLKPGHSLLCLDSRQPCVIQDVLGEGGQGEVYKVLVGGEPRAVKWYNDLVLRIDTGLRRRLQLAIDMGPPSSHFLWPQELVADPESRRFGYVMPLRRPGTEKVHSLFSGTFNTSFRAVSYACWQLTDAMFALHAKGLAYLDINAGNIFFEPRSGAVEICDNDNVDVDGAPSVMGGVMEFQAPEVVMRQAGPSRATDLHSLAVMLFRMLHCGHPLVGRREASFANLADPAVMRKLYGSEALFVYDPTNDSNRPDPERHGPVVAHWHLYPQALRALFLRAFTEGLYDPSARVQESEWRRALRTLHDSVMTCAACGAQSFHDSSRRSDAAAPFACWGCQRPLSTSPLRLGLRRAQARPKDPPDHVVMMDPGGVVFADQLNPGRASPVPSVAAEVHGVGTVLLRNRSASAWRVYEGRLDMTVLPGSDLSLRPGQQIDFGPVHGFVRG
jgi:eukaryotic-like serine/threonine-protein kinase